MAKNRRFMYNRPRLFFIYIKMVKSDGPTHPTRGGQKPANRFKSKNGQAGG
jgi:hypothetical protein